MWFHVFWLIVPTTAGLVDPLYIERPVPVVVPLPSIVKAILKVEDAVTLNMFAKRLPRLSVGEFPVK